MPYLFFRLIILMVFFEGFLILLYGGLEIEQLIDVGEA
jgi:hypothetical protein